MSATPSRAVAETEPSSSANTNFTVSLSDALLTYKVLRLGYGGVIAAGANLEKHFIKGDLIFVVVQHGRQGVSWAAIQVLPCVPSMGHTGWPLNWLPLS